MSVADTIGIIVPDPRITVDSLSSADSSYTEAGARVAVPTSSSVTAAALEGTGTMAAAEYLDVRTQRGGFATRGYQGASYVHRASSTAAWLGDDGPGCFRDWDWIVRRANGGAQSNSRPYALTLQSGRVLLVAHRDAGAVDRTEVFYRDPGAAAWSGPVTVDSTSMHTATHPTLVQLPSGRILCYAWGTPGTDAVAIKLSISDDDGATWTLISSTASPTLDTTDYTVGKLRAAYHGGNLLLLASVYDITAAQYVTWQLASDAAGYQLESIALGDGATASERGRSATPFVTDAGQWVMLYYYPGGPNWAYKVLPSPWASHLDATRVTSTITGVTTSEADELAVFRDCRGIWRALIVSADAALPAVYAYYSRDGLTWYSQYYATIFGNPDALLTSITACDQRGTMILCGEPGTLVEAYDTDSLLSVFYGGNSSVTWPTLNGLDMLQAGIGMPQMIGIEDVVGQGWTRTDIGVPTEAYDALGVTITSAAGTARAYSLARTAALDRVFVDEFDVDVTSGGSLSSDIICYGLRVADGVGDYEVRVRFTQSQLRVIDVNNAGATLATVTVDCTSGIRIRVYLSAGLVSVYYCRAAGVGPASLTWTQAYSGALTNDGATPSAAGLMFFGGLVAGAGVSTWRYAGGIELDDFGVSVSTFPLETAHWGGWATLNQPGSEGTNPGSLIGRRYDPHKPAPITGAEVRLVDGPTAGGDTWALSARYDYPVSRIFPVASPSPRMQWRSTSVADQAIAWLFPDDGLADGGATWTVSNTILSGSGAYGLALYGINFKDARLDGHDGSAWTNGLVTVDAADGLTGLKYIRRGDAVTVDTGTAQPSVVAWLNRAELEGGTFDFGGGVVARILRNTSGRFAVTGANPVIYIDPDTATGGLPATTGTGAIWRPNVVAIGRNLSRYRRLRLTVTAPTATVDGDLRIGVAVIGPYVPLAPYAWGRSLEVEADVEITDLASGLRTSRVRGPARRSVSVSWPDGQLTRDLWGTTIADQFTGGAKGVPADTAGTLAGLLEEIDGPRTPIVLVAGIAGTIQNSAEAIVYGRIMGPVTREVISGTEITDELVRVNEITIEAER